MTPEAKLADFARRVHLQDDDVDYLLSLLQEARGLGLLAGAAAEREACAYLVQDFKTDSPPGTICHWGEGLARIIRKRGKT